MIAARTAGFLGALTLCACTVKEAAPTPGPGPAEAKAEAKADAKSEAKAEADKPPPLTQAELDLIAADPKTLTPEKRRERAYALRKKVMQNPNSPTAKALKDLERAVLAGEIEAPKKGSGVTLSLPGTKPTKGRPPAGAEPKDAAPPAGAEPKDAAPAAGGETKTVPGRK